MSERASRLERFFERALDIGTGSAAHPAELLQRVHTAAEASVRDGAIANAYRIDLDEANAAAFLPHRASLTAAVEQTLDDIARERRLRRLAPWRVELSPQAKVDGGVAVVAEFRNAPGPAAEMRGATRAIRRHRGVFLQIAGGDRVAVTHTPFSIGRSRECDLTVVDMAISRRHAVIDCTADGSFVIRDAGSRNLIVCEEATTAELALAHGVSFRLGGTTMTFEGTNER